MAKVLITGMSGSGKSTVLLELARRGHRVVDLDDAGWSVEVPAADGSGTEQLWLEDRLAGLLAENQNVPLFIAGCATNQGRFYDLLDVIVLLSVPVAVLLERLATRHTNDFGKEPAQRDRILADLHAVEPLLRRTATAELDATLPVARVADLVEAMAG